MELQGHGELLEAIGLTGSCEGSLELGEFCLGVTGSGDIVSLESLELKSSCKLFKVPYGIMLELGVMT